MSHQDWTDNLKDDAGWNRPYVNESGLISKKYQALITGLIGKSLVCTSNGNVYIFLPILNKWSILCSDEATISLNSLMEMDSASVNYDKAFRPYVSFIERSSLDNIASPIPTSVCIGTNRLRVSRLGETLELVPCEPVLVQHPSYSKSSTIASLCYMPLSMKIIPRTWERTDNFAMYRFISPLFPNNTELLTIEWAIGNALIDPVSTSKAVVLYGKGGTGKTTLLAAIKTSLAGCCGSIPDRSLLGISRGMTNSVASIVVSNRIVTAGDVGGIEDSTNLSVIKTLTGHDYISIPPLSARSSCSLFYATNRLDDPKKNLEWTTDAIMRRVVVVCMREDALSYAKNSMPQDSVSKLDFALRCVHTRLSYPSMPVSPLSVILTLGGSLGYEILPYLTEAHDEISREEGNIVLSILSGILGLNPERIGDLVYKISPVAVKLVTNMYHIVGIRPSIKYYELVNPM